eukprot:scaffold1172_cov144-Skeletonema_menzelii.AAC.2
MAEDNNDDDEIFVYMGGDQQVPGGVRRARIHRSVKIIPRRVFRYRQQLVYVEFHDDIEIIEKYAFVGCFSLRSVKLLGIKIVRIWAFGHCRGLTDVEFGDKLETIESHAFCDCTFLRNITMPHVRNVGRWAFCYCEQLTDLELPEGLESLEERALSHCTCLRRITMPLKDDMIEDDDVFDGCPQLETVELVGGIHKTVASFHMERWRNEMRDEINRINQILPSTNAAEKTEEIKQWMRSGSRLLDHYKAEHQTVLKEAATLLELALWKANLDDSKGGILEREGVRTTRGFRKRARKEICVTSGANIVIKNVLPFLTLLE